MRNPNDKDKGPIVDISNANGCAIFAAIFGAIFGGGFIVGLINGGQIGGGIPVGGLLGGGFLFGGTVGFILSGMAGDNDHGNGNGNDDAIVWAIVGGILGVIPAGFIVYIITEFANAIGGAFE